LGLIVLLAVLQYRWLGQISEAERAQRRATLAAGAAEFAQDFDREITRAYLLFQTDSPLGSRVDDTELAARFSTRYDRWQATARFPRLLKAFYAFSQDHTGVDDRDGAAELRQFDPVTRRLEPAPWPEAMRNWRDELAPASWKDASPSGTALLIRRMPSSIWEAAPAIVVPTPILLFGDAKPGARMAASMSYTLLMIDRDYIARELLPSLAERHFGRAAVAGSGSVGLTTDGLDFKVAVVSRTPPAVVFQSTPSFAPGLDTPADATADFFQVRTQDFLPLAAEVRRFTAFVSSQPGPPPAGTAHFTMADTTESRPMSIVITPGPGGDRAANAAGTATTTTTTRTETRLAGGSTPHWKLVVTHSSGSLEAAVSSQRRRNLFVSSSVLGLLGASMGLLVLATRRAQRLARQQMEFVAAVSHELRTPLAVIRSAAENLADGVVHDEAKIRSYGELMRTEGRRLTDMVEQILEFAGIQSGQRGFALRPVGVGPLLHDIVSASSELIAGAGMVVEFAIPADLPAVLGDEPALRRAFQNLIDNAIKYGAAGGSIRVSARPSGSQVHITVADRGIGIEAADHARIFEPFYRAADVVAAQVQGAGLGLSLVQRIVVAHGGRVTVKSAPREGSAFTVQLPAAGDCAVADRFPAGQTDHHSSADTAGVQAFRPVVKS
jgi:signal transduction histidine kinase